MSFLLGAVDVIAQPANVYTDPVMDYALANVPAWFWVLTVFLFIIVATNMFWIYRRMVMRPVMGYLEARKHGQPQTLFLGKNRAFMIKYLEYIDSILAYKDITDIAKWLVQSPKSVFRLGGLSVMLVRDNLDLSADPIAEIAIIRMAKEWNKEFPDEPFNNYKNFEQLRTSGRLEEENPDGVAIPLYSVYDPSLIQKYLPQGRSAGTFGSHLTEKAKSMKADRTQERWYERFLPIGVALTISIIMLILSYMYGTGGV